jgi:Flp pilus assembly pilin Flp
MRRVQLALAIAPSYRRRGLRERLAGRVLRPGKPAGVLRLFLRLTKENVMKAMNLLAKLVRDEQGGEVLEYALIVGLIIVAAIAAITSVGTKVLAKWTSLNASM